MTEPFTRNITDRNRELLRGAEALVYKETPDGVPLEAYIFRPGAGGSGEGDGAGLPVVMFFFSGAWDTGTVTQFAPQCIHLAGRGLVAIACDYRVRSRHASTPLESMADARSAFRWVRGNASDLGIDPHKVVGAGGSAGAQLVVASAFLAESETARAEQAGDGGMSCRPDAMVLFSPILDISKKGYGMEMFPDAKAAALANPLEHVSRGMPPTLIFHSKGDRRVPVAGSKKFSTAMRKKKNVCKFVEYEGVDHSFFNFNVDSRLFDATMVETVAFLGEVF